MARKKIDSTFSYENETEEKGNQTVIKIEKPKKRKKRKAVKAVVICLCIVLVLSSLYLLFAFAQFSPFKQLRIIYIETAMTTGEHQWLATAFFPESVINKVMDNREAVFSGVNESGVDTSAAAKNDDILGQKNLSVGDKDYAGNEILVNDIEQGIIISKVTGDGFVGKIVLIDDPSRVFLATTENKNVKGQFMRVYLADDNAIVGMNASGFPDPNGRGTGGTIDSMCVSDGSTWGTYNSGMLTIGFDKNNKLIVGQIDGNDWPNYNLRDCCQFYPALIIDGKQMVTGSAGWGVHPRTIIGQRADGVVFFLVIDGRQVGYSIGATVGQCADILMKYNAVNAAACDGGSSSVLGYNGAVISKPSATGLKESGRYLPDAWLVKKK